MVRRLISVSLVFLLWGFSASAQLEFEERVSSLGEVFQFQEVEHTFRFVNRSSQPVTILETEAILKTGTIEAVPTTVPPGEGGEVRVRQPVGDRLGQTGFRYALRTDDPASAEVKLLLEGFVHSAYTPETGRVEFGDVLKSQGAAHGFALTSREADDLGEIRIVQGPDFVEVETQDAIAGGQGRRLVVRLTPEVPLGFVAGKIELRTAVEAQPSYLLEYRAMVYGDIVPSENPANLGLVRLGETFTKEILFRSRDGEAVALERIEPATLGGLETNLSECPGEPACQRLELAFTPAQVGELRGVLDLHFAGQDEPMPLTYSGIVASPTAVVHDLGVFDGQTIRVEGRKHLKPSGKRPPPQATAPQAPPTASQDPPGEAATPAQARTDGTTAAEPRSGPASEAPAAERGSPAGGDPSARLAWSVRKQDHIFGYFVYRSDSPEGPFRRVSDEMVQVPPGPGNIGRYEFVDRDVEAGETYYYFIDLVTRSGLKERLSDVLSKTVDG